MNDIMHLIPKMRAGGVPVFPCKPESICDKPKRPFTDYDFKYATTDTQKIEGLWLEARTCRSASERLGTAGSRS